ncbi:aquaporin-like protein [Plenodomus tracheiphilus IPT5]|uniref:Aquaporin-like protein n=1 Tax=Plenodomus tracheiphilus IPT5 TaxID=1408161 RepID=A0A6A7BHK1_9PLEO|nr:aquaporin-like protein [Plenodomus tracheiphilus IPT5]
MAQEGSPFPQYYGQQLHDGTPVESPGGPQYGRESSESRHELLRLPIQPHPAHIDSNQDNIPPASAGTQPAITPKSSSIRRTIGQGEPNDWYSPGRAYSGPEDSGRMRKPSRDFRNVVPSPSQHRPVYVEDEYSDEEEDPRVYRRRYTRQHRRPPVAYENYQDFNSRYGRLPSKTRGYIDPYTDTPTKPQYHMHYGSDDEERYRPRRPGMPGAAGGRGPPSPPVSREAALRLPWAVWMGSNAKNHFVAFVGEFVGTTMFLFFSFSGTQVANIGSSAAPSDNTTTGEASGFSPIVLLYIALVFAFSLMVNVWVFFRISGGLFNPAVTFAMLLCRAMSPLRGLLLFAAQIAGSIFASYLVSVLFPTDFNVRTTLGEGTSLVQGFFIEMVLTAELVFTIFMLAKEKHKATFIAPVGIGLALFIGELVGVYYTGGSLNPARSFGPCVVAGVWDKEHWIYWVGPLAGAIFAVAFYQFIKILEYEVANPGQDDDDKDLEVKQEVAEREGVDPESLTPSGKKKKKHHLVEANGFGDGRVAG